MDYMWTPSDAEIYEDMRVVIFTINGWYNKTHNILPQGVEQYWDLSLMKEGIAYQILVDSTSLVDFDIAVYDGATLEVRGNEISFWSIEGPFGMEEVW